MTQPGSFQGTPKETLRALKILFAALVLGVCLFTLVVVIVNQLNGPVMEAKGLQYKNVFLLVAAILAGICLLAAHYLYNKRVTLTKNSALFLADKLNQYRATFILYLALCEGPALFSIIIFFLTGNYTVLIITAVMLTAMLVKAPLLKRIVTVLNLDWKEQQELE
jgi:hypothetical protein